MKQLFEQTSQYRNWLFTQEKLDDLRKQTVDAAVKNIGKYIIEEWKASGSTPPKPSPDFLTPQDQLKICHFYETKIMDYCKFFKFSSNIQATAVILFKRFYLHKTVMDYDPKVVLLTCLFLSTKIENSFFQETKSLKHFLSQIPKPPTEDTIKDLEYVVSEAVQFDYMIHHPYWPLYGFFLDMQDKIVRGKREGEVPGLDETNMEGAPSSSSTLDSNNTNNEGKKTITGDPEKDEKLALLSTVYGKAIQHVNNSLLTDLPFLYWPSQTALASFVVAAEGTDFAEEVKRYIEDDLSQAIPISSTLTITVLMTKLDAIGAVLKAYTPPAVPEVKVINKKLSTCENPEFKPTSHVHKRKREEEEKEAEEKKAKKIAKEKEKMKDIESIF